MCGSCYLVCTCSYFHVCEWGLPIGQSSILVNIPSLVKLIFEIRKKVDLGVPIVRLF